MTKSHTSMFSFFIFHTTILKPNLNIIKIKIVRIIQNKNLLSLDFHLIVMMQLFQYVLLVLNND